MERLKPYHQQAHQINLTELNNTFFLNPLFVAKAFPLAKIHLTYNLTLLDHDHDKNH